MPLLWIATISGKHYILFVLKIRWFFFVFCFFTNLQILWCRQQRFIFHEAFTWLKRLVLFLLSLFAIWLKVHIIDFAYSFIKFTVLQKNALAYDFFHWFLPFPWKGITLFIRWIFSLFFPHPLSCCASKMNFLIHSAWIHCGFQKCFSLVLFRLRYFIDVCLLLHFPILRNRTYPQYNLGLGCGRI